MKITIYELLGMIKDGKAPKRIRFLNHYYIWKENDEDYQKEDGLMLFGNIKINYILNSEVETLEEKKKIPEKLIPTSLKGIDNLDEKIEIAHIDTISVIETVNQVIDYLKSKGE